MSSLDEQQLVRWDGLRLVVSLAHVERLLRERLEPGGPVSDLSLLGAGDAVVLSGTVRWRGVPLRLALVLAEIRLRHRHLGLRIRRASTLGGLPVPRAAVEALLDAVGSQRVTLVRGSGIVIVDLSRWMPETLDLSVVTVQATDASLHLWFGPGGLARLPQQRAALAAGEAAEPA